MVNVRERGNFKSSETIESFSDDSTQDMLTNKNIEAIVQSYSDEIEDEDKANGTRQIHNEAKNKVITNRKIVSNILSFSGKLGSESIKNVEPSVNIVSFNRFRAEDAQREIIAMTQKNSGEAGTEDIRSKGERILRTSSLNHNRPSDIIITKRGIMKINSYSDGISNDDAPLKNTDIVAMSETFNTNIAEGVNREIIATAESYNDEFADVDRIRGIAGITTDIAAFCKVESCDIMKENREITTERYCDENNDDGITNEDMSTTVVQYGRDHEDGMTLNNNIAPMIETYCDERVDESLVELYNEKYVSEDEVNRNNETAAAIVPYIGDGMYNEMTVPVDLYINDTATNDGIMRNIDSVPIMEPYSHEPINETGLVELYTNEAQDEYNMTIRDRNATIAAEIDEFNINRTMNMVAKPGSYTDGIIDDDGIIRTPDMSTAIEPFNNATNNPEMPASVKLYTEERAGEDGIIRDSVIASTIGSYNNEILKDRSTNRNVNMTVSSKIIETRTELQGIEAIDEEQAMRDSVIATIESLTEERENRERNAMVDIYNSEVVEGNTYEIVEDDRLIQLYSDQTVDDSSINRDTDVRMTNEAYSYENVDERINNTDAVASMVLFNNNMPIEDMERPNEIVEMTEQYSEIVVDENIIYTNFEMTVVTEPYSNEAVNEDVITDTDRTTVGPYSVDTLQENRTTENMVIVSTIESYDNNDRISGIREIAANMELYSDETMDVDAIRGNNERIKMTEANLEMTNKDVSEGNGERTETTESISNELAKDKVKVNREILTEPNADKVADVVKKKKSKTVGVKVDKKREKKSKTDTISAPKTKRSKVKNILKDSYNDERIDEQTWKNREKTAIALIRHSKILPFKTSSGFKCFYCDETYGDIAVLTTHTNSTHDSPDETQIRNGMSKLKKFHFIKVNVVNVACKLCDDTIVNFTDLKKHIARKHNIDIDEVDDGVIPFKISNGECECVLCGVKFPGSKGLSSHMNEHFPNHTCLECGLGFMTIERLKSHSLVHTLKSHPCEICGKEYKSESAKYNHFRIVHKNEKVSKCPHCVETFTSYYTRQRHILSVHGIKTNQYHCEICLHTFLMKNLLTSHMETVHTKRTKALDRPHKCTECEMRFTRQSYLRDHMVKHTGTRNFQCSVCLKWYGRKKTLTAHKRAVHSIRA